MRWQAVAPINFFINPWYKLIPFLHVEGISFSFLCVILGYLLKNSSIWLHLVGIQLVVLWFKAFLTYCSASYKQGDRFSNMHNYSILHGNCNIASPVPTVLARAEDFLFHLGLRPHWIFFSAVEILFFQSFQLLQTPPPPLSLPPLSLQKASAYYLFRAIEVFHQDWLTYWCKLLMDMLQSQGGYWVIFLSIRKLFFFRRNKLVLKKL